MSKQSDAKAKQGYVKKAFCCGDCQHLKFEMLLPEWMRGDTYYDNEVSGDKYKRQKNLRCGIGGFAVGKAGFCAECLPKRKEG